MQDEPPFFRKVQAVISRYLAGELTFDSAADELAAILRAFMQPGPDLPPLNPPVQPPRRLSIRNLSPSEWMTPAASHPPVTHVLHGLPLVPGGSEDDEQKAQALFEEAFRRAERSEGDAA